MTDMDTPDRPPGGGFDFSRLIPQRSFGLKLILVCALALLMAVPAAFVWALVYQRSYDAQRAMTEVSDLRGGQQDLMGPAIVVPYERDVLGTVNGVGTTVSTTRGRMVLYAEKGAADVKLTTERLRRGLQSVPTYLAETHFTATFDPSRLTVEAPAGTRLQWSDARIYLGMGDLRGAKVATIDIAGRKPDLSPAGTGATAEGRPLSPRPLVSAPLGWTADPGPSTFTVQAQLNTSGAQRISVAAFARDTTVSMNGTWTSPSFDGGLLPDKREVSSAGFTATWTIPFLARGTPGVGADLSFDGIMSASPGVTLIEQANPYQSVERALKYAPLFIGLVFLTYFLFEATSGTRAHPAQYVLVGLAQTVFYMLLLSISEVVGFNYGFGVAATCTVLALSLYAGSVFASRWAMLKALGVFSTLYGLIYTLMRQEEYALLVGSIASFLAIAGTMWMTRKLDWYGVGRAPRAPQPQA
jgi:inner membrane protein